MEENKIVRYEKGQIQKFNSTISLTNKLLGIDYRNLFVVYLDDHKIFRRGVKIELLKKLPNLEMTEFIENESALLFINECFQKRKRIDLIITDYNHPGDNGFVFAKKIRELERTFFVRTPIIMLTMRMGDEIMEKAVTEAIFDSYFTKNIAPNKLVELVKTITAKY